MGQHWGEMGREKTSLFTCTYPCVYVQAWLYTGSIWMRMIKGQRHDWRT